MDQELFSKSFLYEIASDWDNVPLKYGNFTLFKAEKYRYISIYHSITNVRIGTVYTSRVIKLSMRADNECPDIHNEFCSTFGILPFSYSCSIYDAPEFINSFRQLTSRDRYCKFMLRIGGKYRIVDHECELKYNNAIMIHYCVHYRRYRCDDIRKMHKFSAELVVIYMNVKSTEIAEYCKIIDLIYNKFDPEVTKYIILYADNKKYYLVNTETVKVEVRAGDWLHFVRDYYFIIPKNKSSSSR